MSNTSLKNQDTLRHDAPASGPRRAQAGEVLFEFDRERDRSRWRCELRDHGAPYGVEAQFYQNGDYRFSRTFAPSLRRSQTARELAVQWAEQERLAIEKAAK